jgi:hypothetical protein
LLSTAATGAEGQASGGWWQGAAAPCGRKMHSQKGCLCVRTAGSRNTTCLPQLLVATEPNPPTSGKGFSSRHCCPRLLDGQPPLLLPPSAPLLPPPSAAAAPAAAARLLPLPLLATARSDLDSLLLLLTRSPDKLLALPRLVMPGSCCCCCWWWEGPVTSAHSLSSGATAAAPPPPPAAAAAASAAAAAPSMLASSPLPVLPALPGRAAAAAAMRGLPLALRDMLLLMRLGSEACRDTHRDTGARGER